jgi:hypothetical protein
MKRPAVIGVLMAVFVGTAACHTMRPIPLHDVHAARPMQVWVTRTDESVVLMSGPQIVNERLAGFVNGRYQVMPAETVKQVLVRRPATGRTVALVAAGVVGAAAAVILISGSGGGDDPCALASSECEGGPVERVQR